MPFERLPHGAGLELPSLATDGSAGADVRAAVLAPRVLLPGQADTIPTGLRLAVPPGYEIQVRPRSGLSRRFRIGLTNSPGTIDSDYRGELGILLINLGERPFVIRRGERIAQLVLARVAAMDAREAGHLQETARGAGGFGHSGVA